MLIFLESLQQDFHTHPASAMLCDFGHFDLCCAVAVSIFLAGAMTTLPRELMEMFADMLVFCVAVAALVEKQEIRTTRARSVLSAEDILPAYVVAINLAQIGAPRLAWRDAEHILQGELDAARVPPVPAKEEDMEAPLSCDAQMSVERRSSELYGMQRCSSNTGVETRCWDVRCANSRSRPRQSRSLVLADVPRSSLFDKCRSASCLQRSLSRSWRWDLSSDRALSQCLEYIRHLHILGATWSPTGAFQREYQDGQSRFAH